MADATFARDDHSPPGTGGLGSAARLAAANRRNGRPPPDLASDHTHTRYSRHPRPDRIAAEE